MADESLLDKVHDLTDLELAILLCLVSRQHCIISTPADVIDDLIQELQLVCACDCRTCLVPPRTLDRVIDLCCYR
jgi:hypothetical protein